MSKTKNTELESLIENDYVPSSIERKKSLLMYFLVWIIIWISNSKLSDYEMYHMKQALWWWTIFIILLVASVFMLFIPFVRFVPIFIFVLMLWVFTYFFKQAWDWFYTVNSDKIVLPFFYWIWGWIVDVFDVADDSHQEEKK